MKKLGLRNFSGPFDWLFGATITERVDLIISEFNNYFNKEDLIFNGQRIDRKPNDIYYNKRTKITFNHDFPLNSLLNTVYPKIKEKYNRRTSRIISILKSKKPTLIVFIELPNETTNGIKTSEELNELLTKLQIKFSNNNIDILYIKHDEEMKDGEFTINKINKNITIGSCFNKNRKNNSPMNVDNVKVFFKDIKYANQKINKIKNYIFNFLNFKKKFRKIFNIFYKKKIKNGILYNRICGIYFLVK